MTIRLFSRKFSRRHFLSSAASTGIGVIAMPYLSRAADRPVITHGVQSGDVSADGGVVWARADRPSQMMVEVATTESFNNAKALPPIAALPESDFTAKLLLENLPAGQDIFYRVRFRDLSHPIVSSEPVVGRFRTAPGDRRDVSFVWGGDVAGQGWGINPDDGGMLTFATMRKHRPDFLLHSGDTIYADGPIKSEVTLPDGKVWKNVTIPEKAKVAETLDEFRAAHKYNFMDEHLRAFNADVPVFVQWDDHDVVNNWSLSKELPAAYKERDITLLAARAARAFHEMYPMRESIVEPGRVYRVLNSVWLTADVHYAAAHYYNPDKAQFGEFDPFWEFVAGPLHAGTFGPNDLDNTFGPEVKFIKAPGPGNQNLPPSAGMQFFGHVRIDGASGQMTVPLRDG